MKGPLESKEKTERNEAGKRGQSEGGNWNHSDGGQLADIIASSRLF